MARKLRKKTVYKSDTEAQTSEALAILGDFFKKSSSEIENTLKHVRHKYPHMFSN